MVKKKHYIDSEGVQKLTSETSVKIYDADSFAREYIKKQGYGLVEMTKMLFDLVFGDKQIIDEMFADDQLYAFENTDTEKKYLIVDHKGEFEAWYENNISSKK